MTFHRSVDCPAGGSDAPPCVDPDAHQHPATCPLCEHRADPVETALHTLVCRICRKPVRTWPDGRFPVHAGGYHAYRTWSPTTEEINT